LRCEILSSLSSLSSAISEPGVVACGSSARVYVIIYKSNVIAITYNFILVFIEQFKI
jgi:hypothetical protein